MANLKGSNFDKQIRDANFRLAAFGKKRKDDHKTHSNGIRQTRETLFKELKSFFEKENLQGKFNQLMTSENMQKFMDERLAEVSLSTREKIVSSLSSLTKGLEECNVTIPLSDKFFDKYRIEIQHEKLIKEEKEDFEQINRYIKSVETEIGKIEDEQVQMYAELLQSTGLRCSEAEALMRAIASEKMSISPRPIVNGKITFQSGGMRFTPFSDNKIEVHDIIGKGGRAYQVPKYIPINLYSRIRSLKKIASSSYLNKGLGKHKAHDFRYTFARDFYTKAKEAGLNEKEAFARTSQELGHNRIAMTRYYLNRSKK